MPASSGRRVLGMALVFVFAATAAQADEDDDLRAAFDNGDAARLQANYPEAVRQYQWALARAPRVWGENDTNTAAITNNLGETYRQMGQYDKAASLYLRTLKIYDATVGANHASVGDTLNNLALVYTATAQFAKAEPIYQRSLKIREANYGPNHLTVAASLNNLAEQYRLMGQYDKAEPLYLRSKKIREANNDPSLADSLNNLAILYYTIGQFAKAESYFLAGLKIYEAHLGPGHQLVAGVKNNLGLLYAAMGQYPKAARLHRESLSIREEALGENHPRVADSLNNLGNLYQATRQFETAEPFYQRSLKIREAVLGPEHLDVAQSLNNLAVVYDDQHKFAAAEPLYQRSLKIREDKLGPEHYDVAETLNNLALMYQEQGDLAQAEPHLQRSLTIFTGALGPDHPRVEMCWNNLAQLHASFDRLDAAGDEADQARRVVRKHVSRVLPMLSEEEQLTFLNNRERSHFQFALTLGWKTADNAALAARSAGWLANGKAVAQESLIQQAALGRDQEKPELKQLVNDLTAVRTALANLANAAPKPGDEATRQAELARLSARVDDLARQLRIKGGTPPPAAWVELDAIRQAIPPGGLLVDIVRFEPYVFSAKRGDEYWQPAHYFAWLTPPAGEGEVKVIDLGEADAIDATVAGFQAAMLEAQGDNGIRQLGEPDAEKELLKSLSAVADLLLNPLREQLADKQELILSPDAELWLVPWGALPVGDGTYAIEKWNIHYVISGRDLAMSKVAQGGDRKVSAGLPRIFANPNYDLPAGELPVALASVFGRKTITPSAPGQLDGKTLASLDRKFRSSGTIGRAPLLPGTASEAQAITPNLRTYYGEPKLYAENQALEGVFKRLASPRVLVLSTHGFFLSDQEVKNVDQDRPGASSQGKPAAAPVDKDGHTLENPLLRCGLLFAGCNHRDQIKDRNLDDGILTGMEIVGTDLRATELVVLSACETGLGKVNNGEGVAGLRQAFQLAGAQAVVATLWQIPDRESALLMNDFFANLAAGQDKATALRHAQLSRIAARREQYGAAHPLFWAAFTLTGK